MQNIQTIMSKSFWQGQLVRLRPFTRDDAEVISAEEQDSEDIWVFEPGGHPIHSAASIRERIDQDLKQPRPNVLGFAVEALTGELVGTTNIRDWKNRNGTFTFAIRT